MRLLVTRPEPDATSTAEKLRARGHTVLVEPLLTVTFNPPPRDLPDPAAMIVTSQNGVRALAQWPQHAGWRDKPIFTTGAATARAAAALGFRDVRAGDGDAAGIAALVTASLMKGGPIIYPAARDRAGGLSGGLLARGYDIRTVEAYRADAVTHLALPVQAAFAARTLDGILLFSRRTAATLVTLAAAYSLAASELYVISESVADVVRHTGARLHVAAHPDEDSLLAMIP